MSDQLPSFGYSAGLGAITEDQLQVFAAALRGCETGQGVRPATETLRSMLLAFPDQADRIAIRQRLVTVASTDTNCLRAISDAFDVTPAAVTNSASSATPFFKKPAFWIAIGAAVVVGTGAVIFVQKRKAA